MPARMVRQASNVDRKKCDLQLWALTKAVKTCLPRMGKRFQAESFTLTS